MDTLTDEERAKHEAAFDAYVAENPDHTCCVVGCGNPWNPNTGVLIIAGGGSRDDCSVGIVYYICNIHDTAQSVTVEKDGCYMTFNPAVPRIKKCGVKGCNKSGTNTRFKIVVLKTLGSVCNAEFNLCNEHTKMADEHPEMFTFPQEG